MGDSCGAIQRACRGHRLNSPPEQVAEFAGMRTTACTAPGAVHDDLVGIGDLGKVLSLRAELLARLALGRT